MIPPVKASSAAAVQQSLVRECRATLSDYLTHVSSVQSHACFWFVVKIWCLSFMTGQHCWGAIPPNFLILLIRHCCHALKIFSVAIRWVAALESTLLAMHIPWTWTLPMHTPWTLKQQFMKTTTNKQAPISLRRLQHVYSRRMLSPPCCASSSAPSCCCSSSHSLLGCGWADWAGRKGVLGTLRFLKNILLKKILKKKSKEKI